MDDFELNKNQLKIFKYFFLKIWKATKKFFIGRKNLMSIFLYKMLLKNVVFLYFSKKGERQNFFKMSIFLYFGEKYKISFLSPLSLNPLPTLMFHVKHSLVKIYKNVYMFL